jgi:colanic acid/amylovoran biosynthesis glycosyltransferase
MRDSIGRTVSVGYVLKVFPRLSETFVLNEILELEEQGVNVEVFSLKPSTEARYHAGLAQLKAQIHHLHQNGSPERCWRNLKEQCEAWGLLQPSGSSTALATALRSGELRHLIQAMQLVAEVRKRGVQHLHAHFATSATWVSLLAHTLSGISFSFTAHAKDIYHQDVDRSLLQEALERASFVVSVTDHNVRLLQRHAPDAAHKIHRVYNGIRMEEHGPAPTLVGEKPLILGVGRLVEKKGFRYLIEACRILKQQARDFRCVIIGGGVERGNLRNLISKCSLEDTVELMGPQTLSVVMDHMVRAQMLVLPCIVAEDGNRDALPTVMLEAMALGRPVVSTDLPGVTEIVDHGRTGLLVNQHDSKALAEAIGRILTETGLGIEMGREGRRKAERLFSLRKNVATIASLFEEAVSGSQEEVSHGAVGS